MHLPRWDIQGLCQNDERMELSFPACQESEAEDFQCLHEELSFHALKPNKAHRIAVAWKLKLRPHMQQSWASVRLPAMICQKATGAMSGGLKRSSAGAQTLSRIS